ncbi:MAG: winged helix-turn-helix transcriptional regulator [Clostridia bacterium]|nr:winged helix-turn-helix transcriptional regulator [Clostridia bacterium]
METRDYGKEIDELKAELAKLTELITGTVPAEKLASGGDFVGHVQKMENMHPDPHITALMNECQEQCGKKGSSGCVTYLGVFASGGRQSNWVSKGEDTDHLLDLIDSGSAMRVLSCIGSPERMKIIMTLLKKPMTAAELEETLNFGSTGQVYHHLKPLIAADIVTDDKEGGKGKYAIVPHRVQGIIMLLAGVSDLSDTKYSSGTFADE